MVAADLQLRQKQALALTQSMRQSLDVLRMSGEELDHVLAEAAARNPFIRVSRRLVSGNRHADGESVIEHISAPGPSLAAHVEAQIRLLFTTAEDVRVARRFAMMLDPCGWLLGSNEELSEATGCALPEIDRFLARLQKCEPTGLFARGLSECLRLQAEEEGILDAKMSMVLEKLSLLTDGGARAVAAATGIEIADVAERISRLRRLDPKPGAAFEHDTRHTVQPELRVFHSENRWRIELNSSATSSVELETVASSADCRLAPDISRMLAEANTLRAAVLRRRSTILRVAREAVGRQIAFLERGPSALVRLTLSDIADALDLNISTVSRAVAGCKVDTPRGVVALSSFFDRGTPNGGASMTIAGVRHELARLFAQEPPDAPLSDQAAAQQLARNGISLGRRAVAKHRTMLNIPSQHRRRKVT